MPPSSPPARLFIGSSSEGHDVAVNLQEELEGRGICEVDLWRHAFEPSGYALPSLLAAAEKVDFAVLVATPDDTTISRGAESASVRENIVLEFGLFMGVLGLRRTYLLATGDVRLPSDVLGLTRLPYRSRADGNLQAALNGAALDVKRQVRALGPRSRGLVASERAEPRAALDREIDLLCANAVAQGWTVKANSATTLRLRSPGGKPHTLAKRQPELTRVDLRRFVTELRAAGLRVNSSVRRPVAESPF